MIPPGSILSRGAEKHGQNPVLPNGPPAPLNGFTPQGLTQATEKVPPALMEAPGVTPVIGLTYLQTVSSHSSSGTSPTRKVKFATANV